jgi:hypothetical protein
VRLAEDRFAQDLIEAEYDEKAEGVDVDGSEVRKYQANLIAG